MPKRDIKKMKKTVDSYEFKAPAVMEMFGPMPGNAYDSMSPDRARRKKAIDYLRQWIDILLIPDGKYG